MTVFLWPLKSDFLRVAGNNDKGDDFVRRPVPRRGIRKSKWNISFECLI